MQYGEGSRGEPDLSGHLVDLAHLVYLVDFVHLISFDQPETQTDQTNQTPVLCPRTISESCWGGGEEKR